MDNITIIISIGGTRRAFILEENRNAPEPGQFEFSDYFEYSLRKTRQIIQYYFDEGGNNLILELLDIPRLSGSRGDEYARLVIQYMYRLIDEEFQLFYESVPVQPYFIGLEPLQLLPDDHPGYQLAIKLDAFNRTRQQEHPQKLFLNVVAIPFLSIYLHPFAPDLTVTDYADLQTLETSFYNHFSSKIYGAIIPKPLAYIGTSINGDMKITSAMPLALGLEYGFRLFYLPYPSFFITRELFRKIITELKYIDQQKPMIQYDINKQVANRSYKDMLKLQEQSVVWGLRNETLF